MPVSERLEAFEGLTGPSGENVSALGVSAPISSSAHASHKRNFYDPEDLDRVRELWRGVDVPLAALIPNLIFSQLVVPEIAERLVVSRKMANDVGERFQKTAEFFTKVPLNPDSNESKASIARVKALHEIYGVSPESAAFHYVLYTLTVKFVAMLRRIDTTPPSSEQEISWFRVWRGIARELGATNVPECYETFKRINAAFEADARRRVTPESRQLAQQLSEAVLELVAPVYRPALRRLILSQIDGELANALGIKGSSAVERSLSGWVLSAGSSARRLLLAARAEAEKFWHSTK